MQCTSRVLNGTAFRCQINKFPQEIALVLRWQRNSDSRVSQ